MTAVTSNLCLFMIFQPKCIILIGFYFFVLSTGRSSMSCYRSAWQYTTFILYFNYHNKHYAAWLITLLTICMATITPKYLRGDYFFFRILYQGDGKSSKLCRDFWCWGHLIYSVGLGWGGGEVRQFSVLKPSMTNHIN